MTLSVRKFKLSDTIWSDVTAIVVSDSEEGLCTLEVTSVPSEIENDFYTGDPEEERMSEEEYDEIMGDEDDVISEYTEVYTGLSIIDINNIFKSIKVKLSNLHTLLTEDVKSPICLKCIEDLCPNLCAFNQHSSYGYRKLILSRLI